MGFGKDFGRGFRFGFEHPFTAISSLFTGKTDEKMKKYYGDGGGRWGGGGVPTKFPAGFGDRGKSGLGITESHLRQWGFGDTGAAYLQPTTRRIIGQRQAQSPNYPYVLA